MMTFSSPADLSRLQQTDPTTPVINKLANGLFSDTDNNDPVTVALMESHDDDHPLADLCSAEDVTLEGIIERENVFMIVLQTDYGYGIVLVIPDEDWLTGELHQCVEENLYN